MRLLIVAPRFPHPLRDGLLLRIYHLLREAAKRHEVTLIVPVAAAPAAESREALKSISREVILTRRPTGPVRTLRRGVAALLGGKPFTIAKYFSPQLADFLRRSEAERKFDLVHFHTVHMGQYAPLLERTPTLLDTPDVVSEIWRRGRDTRRNPLLRYLVGTQYRAILKYEPWVYAQSDLIAACSKEDQAEIGRLAGPERVRLIPNGVDSEYARPMNEPEEPNSMVFVGNMQWAPNWDGALWFCQQVLPLIAKRLPGAKLYIVGNAPGPAVQRLVGPSIVVTGSVPDVRPYIARAAVSVVPLRVGGGTRLKILEALAMEKPVVSTTLGCQGLGLEGGKHLEIADDPQSFAEAVGRLLTSPERRRELAKDGREVAVGRYDWKVIGEGLERVYQELSARKGARL